MCSISLLWWGEVKFSRRWMQRLAPIAQLWRSLRWKCQAAGKLWCCVCSLSPHSPDTDTAEAIIKSLQSAGGVCMRPWSLTCLQTNQCAINAYRKTAILLVQMRHKRYYKYYHTVFLNQCENNLCYELLWVIHTVHVGRPHAKRKRELVLFLSLCQHGTCLLGGDTCFIAR